MGRAPCCDKSKVKRGLWSTEEDSTLVGFIEKNGHSNWRALPKQAGLMRCGKSCRLRWINYLRPDLKRGNFTLEEEQTIINLHNSMGNKWAQIASHLPGRTDNEIKNVWNTYLKRRHIRKTNKTKSGSQKNEAVDTKMDHSASPSPCTSSSITVSGSDPNMEKGETDQDVLESEIKKPDEVPEPKEAGKVQDSVVVPESSTTKAEENCTCDGKIVIPIGLDIDIWEMLDTLEPLEEQIGEIDESNMEEFDFDVDWLPFLKGKFGLTTDSDNLPNQENLEIGHELDYVPTLNGSSSSGNH